MIGDHLTCLINEMDDHQVEDLLLLFTNVDLEIERPPRSGLMMLTVRDSFDVPFHLGEVLVTKASVTYRQYEGFGMVLGNAPRKALAKAAVDAVLRHPEKGQLHDQLSSFMHRESQCQERLLAEQAAMIAATRVSFDLMPGA